MTTKEYDGDGYIHQNISTTRQRMFRHPFSFKGRITRSEYVISLGMYVYSFIIFGILIIGMFGVLDGFSDEMELSSDSLFVFLFFFVLFPLFILFVYHSCWFIFAQGVKRCHDLGYNGWYQFLPLYCLWMMFANGDEGSNEYGPDPKGRINDVI